MGQKVHQQKKVRAYQNRKMFVQLSTWAFLIYFYKSVIHNSELSFQVDENGIMNGNSTTYAICGQIRRMVGFTLCQSFDLIHFKKGMKKNKN